MFLNLKYSYIFNCTNISQDEMNCQSDPRQYDLYIWSKLIEIIISGIGIILNIVSIFILIYSNNTNIKFLKYLKIYSFNSLIINISIFIISIIFYILNKSVYISNKIGLYDSETYMTYYIHGFMSIITITYTFSGVMDIAIIYERIQLYSPRFRFLKQSSAYIISLCILLFCCILNLPPISAREVKSQMITINQETFYMYKFTNNFDASLVLKIILLCITFLRDIVPLIGEIFVNIILVVVIVRYFKQKSVLQNQKKNSIIPFNRTNLKNSYIALVLCLISVCNHMLVFLGIVLFLKIEHNTFLNLKALFEICYSLRHSINFFIFLILNKKFRENFMLLIKIKNKKIISNSISAPPVAAKNNSTLNDDVNIPMEIMTTHC